MRDVTTHAVSENSAKILEVLRELIARDGGSISFEVFMEMALYHPQHGYYSRRVPTIGRGGDFSTSATLHGALGSAVAAWGGQRRHTFDWRGEWHFIELGGGTGQMADEILRALGWWARRHLHYHIVESSGPLREQQRARLQCWPMVQWHEQIEEALRSADGKAIIVSNEFVDAFPCLRFERGRHGSDWDEVRLTWVEGTQTLAEKLFPSNGLRDGQDVSTVFSPVCTALLPPGQRVEWHRSYSQWLRRWATHWRQGCLLTVDYGDVFSGLYRRSPAGTIRGYFRHLRLSGQEIYQRMGWQDLTADVNFNDLMRWGAGLGWENTTLCTQGEFLSCWLSSRWLRRHGSDSAWKFLQDAAGAGGAFKVLEQRR